MTPYNDVRFGLLGGSIVDANALLRSYIWHCIGIPIVASVFMILHFWRVRKDGGISGPAAVVLDSEVKGGEASSHGLEATVGDPSAPDNVPIMAMIPLLAFYIYLAWKQAHANELLIAQLEGNAAAGQDAYRKAWPFQPGGRKKSTSGRFCCAWSFSPPSSSPSS